jgi:hypothetical protein
MVIGLFLALAPTFTTAHISQLSGDFMRHLCCAST